jgi:Ca2+-binding EF-hand superfamily protein
MGGMFDPSKLFDMMSGGKDVVTRDGLPNPLLVGMFDRYAERMGITNGQITREQFNAYMQQRMAGGTGAAPGGTVPAAPPGQGGGPPPWAGGFRGGSSDEMFDRWAEESFRRMDLTGDGFLNYDEMSDNLRAERDKWDTNKDGVVDLNEYKAYFRAAMQQRMNERNAMFGGAGSAPAPPADPGEDEEPKPVVYRAGKLPKDLPSWFKTVDSDGDGQISLYEWRSASRPLDEFSKIDRNGDGFLTISEVMYSVQGKNYLNGVAMTTTSADTKPSESSRAPGGDSKGSMFSRFGGGFPGGPSSKGGDGNGPSAPSADSKSGKGLPFGGGDSKGKGMWGSRGGSK